MSAVDKVCIFYWEFKILYKSSNALIRVRIYSKLLKNIPFFKESSYTTSILYKGPSEGVQLDTWLPIQIT